MSWGMVEIYTSLTLLQRARGAPPVVKISKFNYIVDLS